MSESAIILRNASKVFRYARRQGLKGLLRPETHSITAVDSLSLQINRGESVAFIGPNGAGKSTTIKMLCGILQPTKGVVRVLGLEPIRRRRQLAYQIGTVFGQRSQLIFNLPLVESLRLTAAIYAMERNSIQPRITEVIEQFDLGAFADQPVRKLSLGQRMRAEIANSLLHNPTIIFLDEPTIGLDVVAKRSLREVIRTANKQQGTTIFLTSHDSGDIQAVCDRAVIINHGRIVLDMPTDRLKKRYLGAKRVRIVPKKPTRPPSVIAGITPEVSEGVLTFSVDAHNLQSFLPALLKTFTVDDMTIEDTPLEDIIHELYIRQAP